MQYRISKIPALTEILSESDKKLLDQAKKITVSDEAGFLAANDLRISLSRRLKDGKAELTKPCDEYHKLHKASVSHRTKSLAPYIKGIYEIDCALDVYEKEIQRKADEEAAILQKEARKQAEAEQLDQAEALEAEGREEEAEAVISEPVQAPYIPPVSAPLRVAGIAKNVNWKYEIVDASKLKPDFLIPDEKAIGAMVRSLKGRSLDAVGAGAIRVWPEEKRRSTGR